MSADFPKESALLLEARDESRHVDCDKRVDDSATSAPLKRIQRAQADTRRKWNEIESVEDMAVAWPVNIALSRTAVRLDRHAPQQRFRLHSCHVGFECLFHVHQCTGHQQCPLAVANHAYGPALVERQRQQAHQSMDRRRVGHTQLAGKSFGKIDNHAICAVVDADDGTSAVGERLHVALMNLDVGHDAVEQNRVRGHSRPVVWQHRRDVR
jgi:hypothetical protein